MEDFLWSEYRPERFHAESETQQAQLRAQLQKLKAREETEWEKKQTDDKLKDRINVCQAKEKQLRSLQARLAEAQKTLADKTTDAEKVIGRLREPRQITLQTRSVRESCEILEFKGDPVIRELMKKALLDCRMAAAELIELQATIQREIEKKQETMNVDYSQLILDEFSAKLSFKPDAARIPSGFLDIERWINAMNELTAEILRKLNIIESMTIGLAETLAKALLELESQQETTTNLIRQILQKLSEAIDEAEFSLKRLSVEIESLLSSIEEMEQFLRDLQPSAKLIETRLENRSFQRPVLGERVEDEAQASLRADWRNMAERQSKIRSDTTKLKEILQGREREKMGLEETLKQLRILREMERECLNCRCRIAG